MKFFLLCFFSLNLFAGEEDLRVMGVGFCAIDLMVQVDDTFVEEHICSVKGDSHLGTFDLIDNVIAKTGKAPKAVPGGSAANTVRALSHLGQPCAFLGHVGQDHWGNHFSDNLAQLGVDLRLKDAPFTARVLCLISPDGQRTFLACDPEVDSVPTKADFQGIRWLHLEARNLQNRSVFETSIAIARLLGIPISLDLSCCTIVDRYKEDLLRVIANDADLVFCNEDEIAVLTGMDPEAGCMELQQMCSIGIVTLGEKGCLVGHQGNVTAVPAYSARVVDTTGAGDYFSAGFIYGYLRNRSLEECARIGHHLANAVVEVIGTELPYERWEKIVQTVSSEI